MNLDQKLKKYAAHIENPKYYKKIRDILLEAFETNYQFESFNYEDLAYIHEEIDAFFDSLTSEKDQKRMIKFCNSYWFVISDKNYALGCTPNLFNFWSRFILYLIIVNFIKALFPLIFIILIS